MRYAETHKVGGIVLVGAYTSDMVGVVIAVGLGRAGTKAPVRSVAAARIPLGLPTRPRRRVRALPSMGVSKW